MILACGCGPKSGLECGCVSIGCLWWFSVCSCGEFELALRSDGSQAVSSVGNKLGRNVCCPLFVSLRPTDIQLQHAPPKSHMMTTLRWRAFSLQAGLLIVRNMYHLRLCCSNVLCYLLKL